MPKPKNESIGEVECPAKGCALMVPVYRFKPRENERQQRFANKLYCRCPKHGQFGGGAGDEDMQIYIEEHSRKCAPVSAGAAPEKEPEKKLQPLSPPAPKASDLPPPKAPVKRSDLWDM